MAFEESTLSLLDSESAKDKSIESSKKFDAQLSAEELAKNLNNEVRIL